MSNFSQDGKVWFITGASKGFGRSFAEAALERGDRVVATARKAEAVADLADKHGERALALPLDVTDRAAIDSAVRAAVERFGRLDVVVNNAGYGLLGAIEEATEQQVRDQMEVNFFGAIWVSQAVLPQLRAQGSGHIVQVTSVGGVLANPMGGFYNASKWALEAASESLSKELAEHGVHVTLVEPGPFDTDWAGPSAVNTEPNPAYDKPRQQRAEAMEQTFAAAGSTAAAAQALFKVVDAEQPPLRVLFGANSLERVETVYAERLRGWREWADVAREAHG